MRRTRLSCRQLDGLTPRFYFTGGIFPGQFWSIERVRKSAHSVASRSSGWNVAVGRDARRAPHVGRTCTRIRPSRNWSSYLKGRAASEAKNCQDFGIEGNSGALEKRLKMRRGTTPWLDQGFLQATNPLPWSSNGRRREIGPRRGRFLPSIAISCQISSDSRAQRSRK